MKQHIGVGLIHLYLCSILLAITVYAGPLPANNNQQELDVLQIPLENRKELDILTVGTSEDLTDRNKRTIGLLREIFPEITKQGDGSIDLAALNKQLEETIRVARQASEAAENAAKQQQQQQQQGQPQDPIINNEVQQQLPDFQKNQSSSTEQQSTESKAPAIDELSLDSNEDSLDDDDRNKRFLPFGGSSGGAAGGGGGGSGNFLFDIVRLFSGSVQTQTGDEASNDVGGSGDSSDDTSSDSDANRAADGYTEGIPGPVTRFVVLANRGLASLIQDLILRIAATSERLVNFKAKLITALI